MSNKSYIYKWNMDLAKKKSFIFSAWEPRRLVTLFNYVHYTHFLTCHPPGVKRGFIKEEALRLLRTNSSKTFFKESVTIFKTHLLERG